MLPRKWLALAFAVLISCTGYGQTFERPAADFAKEEARKIAAEGVKFDGHVEERLADFEGRRIPAALAETPRNFVLEGQGTSTDKGFGTLVEQAFYKVRLASQPGATPAAGMIFSELQAENLNRWFWQQQKLSLQGDLLQVKPALFESGEVKVNMPQLGEFYKNAIHKMNLESPKTPAQRAKQPLHPQ